MNILKIKLEQLGQLTINKEMCKILLLSLKSYHENLDTKSITDNKKF